MRVRTHFVVSFPKLDFYPFFFLEPPPYFGNNCVLVMPANPDRVFPESLPKIITEEASVVRLRPDTPISAPWLKFRCPNSANTRCVPRIFFALVVLPGLPVFSPLRLSRASRFFPPRPLFLSVEGKTPRRALHILYLRVLLLIDRNG